MTCQHDPQFRIENEANGGQGCPLCNKACKTNRAALQAACEENGVTAQWYPAQPLSDEDYERMSTGKPDGVIEHDDWLAGAP